MVLVRVRMKAECFLHR